MKAKPMLRHFFVLAGSSLLAISSASAQATSNTWDTNAAGNWTTVTNWVGNTAYAAGADNTATFGDFINGDRIITLDADITIGNITASDTTHNYIISGANVLTLDVTTGAPSINVTSSGRTLEIASEIAGDDGLTKIGPGTLVLSGTNSYTGLTTVSSGTLGSSGTFSGPVTVANSGALSPGTSAGAIGTMTISDASASALTLNAGTLNIDLPASGTVCDLIAVTGNLVLNGTTSMFFNIPSSGLANGTTYTLMTYGAKTGTGSIVFPNGSTTMGNLTLTTGATSVTLTVGGTGTGYNKDVWKGGASSVWNATDSNWAKNGVASPLTTYADPDEVLFDDTATAGYYTVSGSASPGFVTVNNSTTDYTISANIGGSGALIKNGTKTLSLTGTNTFGNVFINAGVLKINSAGNLGSGNVTFTGNGTLQFTSNTTLSQGFVINEGATGTLWCYKLTNTMTNPLAGSGTLNIQTQGDGYGGLFEFTNTNNTFSGNISIYNSSGGSYAAELRMNSLDDTPGRRIKLGNNGQTAAFSYGAGAVVPLVLNNRQIEHNANFATLNNNATDVNSTITVNTDLIVSRNANLPFALGGSNVGNNTFAGAIGDRTGYATSLTKAGAGKWILTGANTYSGTTTIQDGPLEIRGAGQLGAGGVYPGDITSTDTTPSPFIFDSSANTTISGTISGGMSFTKDGAGTLSITGSAIHTGGTTVADGTLSLGNGTNSASLSDFGTLSVASSAVVNLNYTGSDYVFYLNLDGSPAAAGTWGATGSGATHIDDTHFTGTGVIYNLAGNLTAAGIAFWDGGSVNIGSDGNAASAGGAGTWDTTTLNWDVGPTAHVAWLNNSSSKAVFAGAENANRTVTLAGAVNIGELSFETTGSSGTRYIIDGGTLNFGAGGMIRTADNRYDQTITSAITGSPAVETKDFGANNQYKGLRFAPTTGNTQTLGAVLNPNNTGNQDKAGFALAGSSTGNSVASINYAGGDQYGHTYLQSGEWSIPGGIRTGNLFVTGGTFTLGGTVKLDYNGLDATGGVIKGAFTLGADDRRTSHYMKSGSTISPGNSIGTITVDWDNSQTPSAGENDFSLWFQNGSTYDWEVGAGNTTDKIHFVDGRLYVDNMTINIIDAGGTPSAGDQLPIFTYDVGVSVDITGFANSFGPLPAGWTGTPSLGHDTVNRVIYVTGISAGASTPYDTWLAGFDFSAYTSPDLTATGNPDGDAHTNLQEFAFGFNPAVADGGGTLTISGGSITQNGPPQIYEDPGTHQFFLRYTRRTDYVAAGLTYTAQFAADSLGAGSFEDAAGGSVVGTGTGAGGVAIEAVAVEFPDALPVSGKKARFGRVEVIQAP